MHFVHRAVTINPIARVLVTTPSGRLCDSRPSVVDAAPVKVLGLKYLGTPPRAYSVGRQCSIRIACPLVRS
ncbi:MAG TPA: hypothetical protein VFN61_16900 [Acidimicrobiales bacterium]|nr:hypothetical protein [Acidimicrobiales bacterium]